MTSMLQEQGLPAGQASCISNTLMNQLSVETLAGWASSGTVNEANIPPELTSAMQSAVVACMS